MKVRMFRVIGENAETKWGKTLNTARYRAKVIASRGGRATIMKADFEGTPTEVVLGLLNGEKVEAEPFEVYVPEDRVDIGEGEAIFDVACLQPDDERLKDD